MTNEPVDPNAPAADAAPPKMPDAPSAESPVDEAADAVSDASGAAPGAGQVDAVSGARETVAEGLGDAGDVTGAVSGARDTVAEGLGDTGEVGGAVSGARNTVAEGATQPAAELGEAMSRARETVAKGATQPPAAVGEELSGGREAVAEAATPTSPLEPSESAPHQEPIGVAPPAPAAAGSAAESVARFDRAALHHRVSTDTRGRTLSEKEFRSLSRRSLLTGAAGALAAVFGWRTLQNRPVDQRIPDVLRTGHEVNESIWRTLFRSGADAPTFDYAESSMMRVNGRHGIGDDLVLANWQLDVIGRDGQLLGTHGVDDLRLMPQTEMTVKHKCVEGWSHIVTWGGVRFSEFVAEFYPDEAEANYVGLSTPDGIFNVGLDMDSMMHSQTMLTLDLQREPLSEEHGAPVRLTTPLKYGTKQIKRIGTIRFSDSQPENDFWTTRGYDWYAGL